MDMVTAPQNRLSPQDDRGPEVARLALDAGVPPLVARLLINRGIPSAAEADLFFRPDESHLYDPFLLAGVAEAADRLVAAAPGGERSVVFGRYETDGTPTVIVAERSRSPVGSS